MARGASSVHCALADVKPSSKLYPVAVEVLRRGALASSRCRPPPVYSVQTSEMPLCARGVAVKGWLRPVTRGERPATPASCGCPPLEPRRVGICATAAVGAGSSYGNWEMPGPNKLVKVCTDIH